MGITLPSESNVTIERFAPAAWELIKELVGGAQALCGPVPTWSDGFVAMPPDARPWRAPSVDAFGWHIDGDQEERRTIDSASVGLIAYSLWSDVPPRGGGTFFAPGALPALARRLAAAPSGMRKSSLPYLEALAESDPDWFELTGPTGTVLITHPLMIHAASVNASRRLRLLSVRTLGLVRRLDLRGPGVKTPLELATLRALSRARPRRRSNRA